MRNQQSTPEADRIDALVPVLGTLFTGLIFVVTFIAGQPSLVA